MGIALQRQKDILYDDRRALLQEHVSSALGIISHIHEKVQRNEISEDDGRRQAIDIIRSISFGDNDYVFISDFESRLLSNRGAPQTEGKVFANATDSRGFRFTQAIADLTSRGQSGFIAYEWPRPGTQKTAPKLTYVAPFMPWKWTVGVGVYTDDLESIMINLAVQFILIGLAIVAMTGVVSYFVVRSVSGPLRAMTGAMTRLARGDLSVSIEGGQRGDEIGAMAHALEVFRDNARENKRLGEEAKATEARRRQDQRQARITLADS
ncbi:cache domain-containing protein, partial [Pararhodospirillum oryzae]|uniref:cache domain-containing protein n=1 Tax=Pararhodospirillum oryzae TaxID=478448 RepID=UPI001FECEF2E